MRTYSALRSQVHTVDEALPDPRSTPTVRSVPFRYSAAFGARSSWGWPSLNSTIDPIVTAARDASNVTPARPAAQMSRPQFGSPPWMAVLTSSEFAITLAALRASVVDAAPVTFTVTSLVAPSPPRTIASANSRQTAFSPSRNVPYVASSTTAPLAPLASSRTQSLVD